MPATTGDGGQSLSVHQLLRQLAPQYLERFGSSMPGRQRQVLKKILSCRTPALGGQMFQCPDCSAFEYRYHSCNDRHCPQCGQTDADAWLARQRARLLLPVPYFLVTFTVPEELRFFIRSNQPLALDLLFAAKVENFTPLHAADDVQEAFFRKLNTISPDEFGLDSIKKGIIAFLKATT